MSNESDALSEHEAICIAKDFLKKTHPRVVSESSVNAEHVAGETRHRYLSEIVSSAGAENQIPSDFAKRFGFDEDHWRVRFFMPHGENVASTLPPTILRVYDSDRRVEIHYT